MAEPRPAYIIVSHRTWNRLMLLSSETGRSHTELADLSIQLFAALCHTTALLQLKPLHMHRGAHTPQKGPHPCESVPSILEKLLDRKP